MFGYDWETMLNDVDEVEADGTANNALLQFDVDRYPGSLEQFNEMLGDATLDQKMEYLDLRQTLINLTAAVEDPLSPLAGQKNTVLGFGR